MTQNTAKISPIRHDFIALEKDSCKPVNNRSTLRSYRSKIIPQIAPNQLISLNRLWRKKID